MDKQWTALSEKKAESVDEVVSTIEQLRGLTTKKLKDDYYKPKKPSSHTPKELGVSQLVLNKLKNLILGLVKSKEKVVVYGDYDVDGVCSTAIIWEYLNDLGVNVTPYIPDRFTDGYGLNQDSLGRVKEANPDLGTIFLVDNGIVAHKSILSAKSSGIKVVVIDHHQSDGQENEADIIVHSTKVCAAALCWLTTIWLEEGQSLLADSQLPLVLLATVADQMELIGINRSLVFHGLKSLPNTKRVGLISLAKKSSIDLNEVDVYKIGFQLAPKINAAGRMDKGIEALRLICTKDAIRADLLADHLVSLNQKRQKEVEKSLDLLRRSIDANQPIIMAHGEFHEGVVGLLAGKLTEEYLKPSMVLTLSEGVYKGSARSRSGFDITSFLRKSEVFISIGGHEMASGFSILENRLSELKEYLAIADYSVSQKLVAYELELSPGVINLDLAEKIALMSPFGSGNTEPLFLVKSLKVGVVTPMGSDGKHVKVRLLDSDGTGLDFVNFSYKHEYKRGESLDVLFNISINKWRQKTYLQCIIRDVRRSSD